MYAFLMLAYSKSKVSMSPRVAFHALGKDGKNRGHGGVIKVSGDEDIRVGGARSAVETQQKGFARWPR